MVIVTWTRPEPGGATAEQEVWLEHEVGATWPPKWAATCPSELKRLPPLICTCWPAGPEDGVSETIVGPFGDAGDVVEEDVAPPAAPLGGEVRREVAGEEMRLR